MKEFGKTNIYVFMLFLILSIILTYPLILNLNNALLSGDPALNTWIISWDIHTLLSDPLNLFNTNIFYPLNENNLAFGENMIATSLLALPITILFNNPILSYNIVFLISFVLSGFGMYLLVYHLIRDKKSAIISGIIFAFSSYRFAQIGHLQILTIQWMPFLFLYFDRFIKDRTYKNLFIFNFFFIMQFLSSWYLAFYSSILVSLYILYQFILDTEIRHLFINRKFQIKIIIFILITLAAILPFTIPYIKVSIDYGFTRSIQENENFSADIVDYMFTSPDNLLYGDISKTRGNINWAEHSLFLGFTSLLLSLYGLLPIRHSIRKYRFYRNQIFYIFLVVIAFILTLGPRLHINGYQTDILLPYNYLYYYIPGFNSMRVPSRFIILVVFGISILSGYGACKLIKKFENKFGREKALISVIAIAFFILIESIYIPIGYNVSLQVGDSIPEVYKWIANEKDDFAIVELPTGYFTEKGNNLWYDTKYMYYSTYHWKKLVNGYNGFFPDSYMQIITYLQEFPSDASISLLKQINVKYVIVHSNEIETKKWDRILNETIKHKDLKIINTFEKDYVIQVGSDNGVVQINSQPINGFLSFTRGWNQFEVWNGIISHWMEKNGTIQTYFSVEKNVTIN